MGNTNESTTKLQTPTGTTVLVQDNSKVQQDAVLLEKSLEVTKITVRQQLKQKKKELEKEKSDLSKRVDTLNQELGKAIKARGLLKLKRLPALVAWANALSELFMIKTNPLSLISNIQFCRPNGGRLFTLDVEASVSSGHAYMHVNTTVQAASIATAKEVTDANSDDLGESITEEPVLFHSGWVQTVRLLPSEETAVRIIREMEARQNAIDEESTICDKRLENLKDYTDTLKAQILRKQIEHTEGGAEILGAMDKAMNAALSGNFLALL